MPMPNLFFQNNITGRQTMLFNFGPRGADGGAAWTNPPPDPIQTQNNHPGAYQSVVQLPIGGVLTASYKRTNVKPEVQIHIKIEGVAGGARVTSTTSDQARLSVVSQQQLNAGVLDVTLTFNGSAWGPAVLQGSASHGRADYQVDLHDGSQARGGVRTGDGAVDMPFAIPNIRVENPEAEAHTRIGWFRSVSNVPHAFAIQSFVAELAVALGRDHKDYLL
jgi:hypothetical protein